MDAQQAYHYLLALQMAQQNNNSQSISYANYQQHAGQPQQGSIPNNGGPVYPISHAPPARSASMRLDLPPPPVFATQVNSDYPNQYGPSTLLYSPYGENPPNSLHPPDGPSQMYPPSYTPGSFQPAQPTSPYPMHPTSGYPPGPGPLQHQQQQQPQATPHTHQAQLSPYYAPYSQTQPFTTSSNGSNESAQMSEYFPPYSDSTANHPQQQQYHPPPQQSQPPQAFISPPIPSPTWQTAPSTAIKTPASRRDPASAGGSSQSGSGHGPKTSRQQFTSCGACRHRRVKCDLKDKQEEMDHKDAVADAERGVGPVRTDSATRRKRIICTNCHDRGMNCVYVLDAELY
jgi:hypothetical protein